jgi:hypothetical protein
VVCDRWRHSFQAFYDDMGPRPSPTHSIDRIDNNGPYAPENCRWATRVEQSSNRRLAQSSRYLTLNGVTRTVAQWTRALGFPNRALIWKRLDNGWSVERTLTEPVHPKKARHQRPP